MAGPWIGEVGFELLYWIPFLAWFTERFEVPRERLVVLSRGGTRDWYAHVASRYYDVFTQVGIGDFPRTQPAAIGGTSANRSKSL